MAETTNLEKHQNQNPISRFFLDNFMKLIISEVQRINPSSILDVGAGEGFTLQALKDHKIGKTLEGIEYMGEAITLGKKLHPSIKIKKGDIYNLDYKANTFDLLLCTEVLEHLDDPEKALKELLRVTKEYLVLSVPNEPIFTIQRIFRGKNLLRLGAHPEHINHWSAAEFEKLVSKHAEIVEKQTPIPWTLIIAKKK